MRDNVLISIVIVNYRVPDFLTRTIQSLREAELYDKTEVIVVDNASLDDSRERITSQFPEVIWIGLKNNIGFGKASNVGAQSAHGIYLLLLNPDTLLSKNTLTVSVDFFKNNPTVGLMGPKIINPDGTLQASCRRSFPSISVSLYKLTGLSRLFPKSKRFGRYNLTYLDPEKGAEVDAISGSFMFLPLTLFRDIGGFDETFFMYGEDLDLCCKVRDKGFFVWYNPLTQIIHFKGKSAAQQVWASRKAFYEAMIIFSRKYKHTHAAFFPTWLIHVGIISLAGLNFVSGLFKTFTACFIDIALINVILWGAVSVRFFLMAGSSPYFDGNIFTMIGMHALLSLSFVTIFFNRGVYSEERYSVGNALIAGITAAILFMAMVFFVKSMALSRIAFGICTIVIIAVLIAWREMMPKLTLQFRRLIFSTGSVVILGSNNVATALIKNVEKDKSAAITGVLWPVKENHPGEFLGYPVLGTIENIRDVLSRGKVDLLLIATDQPWYSYVIETLATVKVKNLTIRWVPPELFRSTENQLPEVIPLRDFSV